MNINDYLNYTDDTVVDIESMSGDNDTVNKTTTRFGNVLYWETESGKIIFAEWKVPGTDRIDRLDEKALQEISGEYYLRSYSDNMERLCS